MVRLRCAPILAALAGLATLAPATARAQEVFGGVLAHGVDTPFTFETGEGGTDIQLGIRLARLRALHAIGSPSPYAFVSVNSAGDTDFVAAGLAWRIAVADGGRVYLRPGIGLSLNDAPSHRVGPGGVRTDLGSRVLFEPELGVGYRLTDRLSAEYQWTHISGARLFDYEQNPGLDMMGVRVSYRF